MESVSDNKCQHLMETGVNKGKRCPNTGKHLGWKQYSKYCTKHYDKDTARDRVREQKEYADKFFKEHGMTEEEYQKKEAEKKKLADEKAEADFVKEHGMTRAEHALKVQQERREEREKRKKLEKEAEEKRIEEKRLEWLEKVKTEPLAIINSICTEETVRELVYPGYFSWMDASHGVQSFDVDTRVLTTVDGRKYKFALVEIE